MFSFLPEFKHCSRAGDDSAALQLDVNLNGGCVRLRGRARTHTGTCVGGECTWAAFLCLLRFSASLSAASAHDFMRGVEATNLCGRPITFGHVSLGSQAGAAPCGGTWGHSCAATGRPRSLGSVAFNAIRRNEKNRLVLPLFRTGSACGASVEISEQVHTSFSSTGHTRSGPSDRKSIV